ncbi:MAG: hypothetical protein ACJ795_06830 [Ktedonobacteraceae bacterium]
MNLFGPRPITFDPEEAILQYLYSPASLIHRPEPDRATVRFLKARQVQTHQVRYATFQDITGQHWFSTFFLTQQEDGSWRVDSESSGRRPPQFEPPELRDCPWIRIKGLSLFMNVPNEFYMYGEVIDKGFGIVRVRLLDANGLILEDTVQNGIVFFWSEQRAALPFQLELYNGSDTIISRQSLFPPFRPIATRVVE